MNLQTFTANVGGEIRRETYQGREHLVAPVVILAEGVHNGVLYSAWELQKFVEAWNGRPLPVNHPQDAEGRNISANSPTLENVGKLFNVEYRADGRPRIVGELWIDREKVGRVAPKVLERINAGQLEVSSGLFMDYQETTGTWNNEQYRMIGRNFRPDHVALLPDSIGACSWQDGCGAPRVNTGEVNHPKSHQTTGENRMKVTHQKKKKGFESLQTNSPAEKERMQVNLHFLARNLDESGLIEAIQTLDYEGARLCDVNVGLTECQTLPLPGQTGNKPEALVIGNVRIEIPREEKLGMPEGILPNGQVKYSGGEQITGNGEQEQKLSLPTGNYYTRGDK